MTSGLLLLCLTSGLLIAGTVGRWFNYCHCHLGTELVLANSILFSPTEGQRTCPWSRLVDETSLSVFCPTCCISAMFIGLFPFCLHCHSECPNGWSRYVNRCFIIQTALMNTADAEVLQWSLPISLVLSVCLFLNHFFISLCVQSHQNACIRLGGTLASIHNTGEHEYIRELIFLTYGEHRHTYIGLNAAVQVRLCCSSVKSVHFILN